MKKFTKGCAVDVSNMPELPYGKVMFNAIKTVGEGVDDRLHASFTSILNGEEFLFIDADGCYVTLTSGSIEGFSPLTPTDILGEHLVKAIEEGYTPWFDGDEIPSGMVTLIGNEGGVYDRELASEIEWNNIIIAYKPIEQPSIESKTLSEKVGSHNHYFKDVSHLETVDVYRVIDLFAVTNPCHQHAIKKILCCGQRGAKDAAKDTQEAIDSLKRALEMMREDDVRD